MAKKVVGNLQNKGNGNFITKIIKSTKSSKTGAYSFKEYTVPSDTAKDIIASK